MRGDYKQAMFALHHLSRCLHILLQMSWQQKKMIHALLISFLGVQEFNIGTTQTIQSNRNHANYLPITLPNLKHCHVGSKHSRSCEKKKVSWIKTCILMGAKRESYIQQHAAYEILHVTLHVHHCSPTSECT